MTEPMSHDAPARKSEASRIVRAVFGIILLLLVVSFAVDNRDDVRVGYVFGDVSAALAIVILGTFVVGVLVGWLLAHRPHRHR